MVLIFELDVKNFIKNFAIIQTIIELEALFTVEKKSPPLQECELPIEPKVIGLITVHCFKAFQSICICN